MEKYKITHEYKGRTVSLDYLDKDQVKQMKKRGGYMEDYMLKYIEGLAIPDTYVDIGAHIGNHTAFFANYCRCSKVISYEAIPEIFDVLEYNLKGMNNVELINSAVTTSSHYHPVFNTSRPGCSTIRVTDKGTACKYEMPNEKVGLIKIDVEGGELDVVMTCMELIERDKPELFIESFKGHEWILRILPNEYKYVKTFNNAPTHYFTIK